MNMKEKEAVFSVVAAIAAIVSAFLAYQAMQEVKRMTAATTYLDLRHRFYDIRSQLPSDYRDPNYRPKYNSEDWNKIKYYWYKSFDEWFIAQKLNPDAFGELWTGYYLDAIYSALQKTALRTVFCDMRKDEFSQGTRHEFGNAVEKLYAMRHPNEVLCGTAN